MATKSSQFTAGETEKGQFLRETEGIWQKKSCEKISSSGIIVGMLYFWQPTFRRLIVLTQTQLFFRVIE